MVKLELTNTEAYMLTQLLRKEKHIELKRKIHNAIRKVKFNQGDSK